MVPKNIFSLPFSTFEGRQKSRGKHEKRWIFNEENEKMQKKDITYVPGLFKIFDEIIVNLYEFANIKTEEDALDHIAKKIPLPQPREIRIERAKEILDRYLLPHLGTKKEDRI